MYTLVSVLIIIACILLILVVLVQNSKGGGLAANFTGGAQVMGVRQTADFLEKATWTLAIALVVLTLLASATIPRRGGAEKSMIEDQISKTVDPNAIPTLPTAIPQASGTDKNSSSTQGTQGGDQGNK
ncbi:MAG: preprotein translocase subunit SecG [Chlorobi bacterium]|nr:preprotein translocase subunit SecG [Chlorobiota bacterium]